MKTETELKIYLLAQTTLHTEWASLLGDKFREALPFAWSFTDRIEDAQVIAWDGLRNGKGAYYLDPVADRLREGKTVLLLQREAFTLFREHPYLTDIDPKEIPHVELAAGNVLPEDLLTAIEQCREKLNHV